MAKVVIHATMTLDGFIARPNGGIDWGLNYDNDAMVNESYGEIGAVVMGNGGTITEDALPYGGQVKVPQFVVTHHPRDPVTVGGLTFTFVDSIERAVSLAREAAGEKSVMLLGGSIDQQCLNAGLVDEIMIHLTPVLICEGIRLFDKLKVQDIELERIELVATSQVTSMRFRIKK